MHPSISFPAVGKWILAMVAAQWLGIPMSSQHALTVLMIFMGIDIVTGLWAAWVTKTVSSRVGTKGISRKAATVALLMFAHLLEKSIGIELNLELAGAMGYSINEAISIVENFARLGVPIPAQLVEALASVQKLKIRNATPDELRKLATNEALEEERTVAVQDHTAAEIAKSALETITVKDAGAPAEIAKAALETITTKEKGTT